MKIPPILGVQNWGYISQEVLSGGVLFPRYNKAPFGACGDARGGLAVWGIALV